MSIYAISVKNIKGEMVSLEKYRGKVFLIVNTATHCGFTKQYEGLQKLYEKYHDQGFEILDFPCNQFAGQAPESDEEIAAFCSLKYHTTFETFSKIDVNGAKASPLYQYLKAGHPNISTARIRWNFTKFLIGRDGTVLARFDSAVTPEKLVEEVARVL
ncbi:MAG TPA: glutathione peroxidase [Bacilli bacterium]|nr:glutathione peroxidase [Bacilli bacterium]